MITDTEKNELLTVATAARNNAFSHLTGHSFGAAVLTTDGQVFGGCNTESTISGLGLCAERSAIDHAVVHGKYEYKAIFVVDEKQHFPCGACLQYLCLFSQINSFDIEIYASDLQGNYQMKTLSEILPVGFRTEKNLDLIKSFKNK
ncbi:MAG TPA: cytidine deaminase [Candidatus Methanoperedens sp.]|nr:cytidine deaminase [Candidatus Methanoperedens sp.]